MANDSAYWLRTHISPTRVNIATSRFCPNSLAVYHLLTAIVQRAAGPHSTMYISPFCGHFVFPAFDGDSDLHCPGWTRVGQARGFSAFLEI
ncbi:hypothetical protein PILCRDRAFT_810080 [Piloderma croceum F 1598]|uniref:Uncharacterized protein n=1 Tax=Piloderma croceum (strain F 1598) TaxID=765440 RepID=A0A0C3GNE9_PILCF|nr:hypothetical protein PILCRDRAFT_810080 [Piloderma croceum F 1598]